MTREATFYVLTYQATDEQATCVIVEREDHRRALALRPRVGCRTQTATWRRWARETHRRRLSTHRPCKPVAEAVRCKPRTQQVRSQQTSVHTQSAPLAASRACQLAPGDCRVAPSLTFATEML